MKIIELTINKGIWDIITIEGKEYTEVSYAGSGCKDGEELKKFIATMALTEEKKKALCQDVDNAKVYRQKELEKIITDAENMGIYNGIYSKQGFAEMKEVIRKGFDFEERKALIQKALDVARKNFKKK